MKCDTIDIKNSFFVTAQWQKKIFNFLWFYVIHTLLEK